LKPLSNNEFTTKIENKVKELNVENEGMFKKQEEKMKEGNSQLNVSEIMKHKNLMFYQELKQKRLSKIKSKLYHKLKNKVPFLINLIFTQKKIKKKLRQQKLNNQNLDPSFQANEIERMTAQRAEVFILK
jgi:U3 small nucleolar RNA-associated protein 14